MGIDQKVLAELESQGLIAGALKVEEVLQGEINANFLVSDDSHQWFVKCFSPTPVPVERAQIYSLQRALADLGVAPRPVYLSRVEDFQVEEVLEDRCQSLSITSVSDALATALASVHALSAPAVTPTLTLQNVWEKYLHRIDVSKRAKWQSDVERLMPLAAAMDMEERVLCHNDISVTHIASLTPLILYDWEYAATGCRYFDIACAAMNQSLDKQQISLLLKAYSEKTGIALSEVQPKFDRYQSLANFTAAIWYESVENSEG